MIGDVHEGIWMLGRFPVGWNLYKNRTAKSIAVPFAVCIAEDDAGGKRFLFIIGPVTFIWLF